MADFDWNSQPDADEGFNWDAHEDVDKPSALGAGVNRFIQEGTAGFSDELVGAGEAAGRAVGLKGVGSGETPWDIGLAEGGPTLDWEILRDAYRKARDKDRGNLAAGWKSQPEASAIGGVAGMVMSPLNKLFPGGAASKVSSTLPAVAGKVAPKGLSLAGQGAITGGIESLGASDAEDLPGMAVDTGLGMLTGGALGKGIDVAQPYLEKGMQKASTGARNLAEEFAARALGAERGTIKKIGYDKVKRAAGQALDEGVLPVLADTEDMIKKNLSVKDRGGKMMGEVYDEIDNAGASTFHPHEVAEKVDDQLGDIWRTPLNKGEVSQFDNTIETILARGDGDIPLREAQALKEELGRAANWKSKLQVTPKEQMARDAYGIINKSIDESVNRGMGAVETVAIDGKPLREVLAKGKQLYGNASTAEQLLQNKLAREQGNKMFGLTDSIIGAGSLGYGGTTGDWQGAAAPLLFKKGMERYGAKAGAHGANAISKLLMKSPNLAGVLGKNPSVLGSLSAKLAEQIAPSSKEGQEKPFDKNTVLEKASRTKYASVLQDAAKRGDQAFGATHFILSSTDPEYRQALQDEELEP